jgi:predicted transcriptional regulator
MHPPAETRPRHRRYSVSRQARLDAETHAKLEELANTFHRKRAAILRHVMQWGLAHTTGWMVDPSIPDRPRLVHMLMDPELYQQVQDAADAHGASVATWLRYAMRQVTPDDFPPSWRTGDIASRSHDSGYYDRRFQLRLDQATQRKLGSLMQTFDRSAAEIIRQLMTQATPEHFPSSWQMTAHEHRAREAQPSHDGLTGRDPFEGRNGVRGWSGHISPR